MVSIGMPVYNGERFIGNAIESVQAQTYTNVEIVICDNCSTDLTMEVCLRYAAMDDRVRYYRNTTNIGVTNNFLLALEHSKGEFFMWACADDIRPAGSLDSLMAAMLRSPKAVMAHGPILAEAIRSRKLIANEMNLMKEDPSERIKEFVKRLKHNAMLYSVYKTETLKHACASTDFHKKRYGHDYHLCLQMCLFGPVEYVAVPMIIYTERTPHPNDDPMGSGRPVTLRNVLTGGTAIFKSWVTLLYGCWYLLSPPQVSLSKRVACLYAFGSVFIAKYRDRLIRDGVLILTLPMSSLLTWLWSLTKRSPILGMIGRKVKEGLIGT